METQNKQWTYKINGGRLQNNEEIMKKIQEHGSVIPRTQGTKPKNVEMKA